jgi:hypothetical protein
MSEELRTGIIRIAQRAKVEAAAGAPAGMVATYVEIEARHILDGHDGEAMNCAPCHEALGDGRFVPA